jgi:hypothetical protein
MFFDKLQAATEHEQEHRSTACGTEHFVALATTITPASYNSTASSQTSQYARKNKLSF